MNIFNGTDSRVMGRKLDESFVSSVLRRTIVHAFFQADRTAPETRHRRSVELDRTVNRDNA